MNMVLRNIALLLVIVMAALTVAGAQEEHGDFSEALGIIESQKECGELTDSEFELLGDYYMELMHPGEAHEAMDAMMGGEGSESLRLMHTRMGQNFYCGDADGYGSSGMMGSGMMNMMGGGMMGSYGMMGSSYGMMGSGWSVWGVLYTLLFIGLIVVVFLLAALLYKKIAQK